MDTRFQIIVFTQMQNSNILNLTILYVLVVLSLLQSKLICNSRLHERTALPKVPKGLEHDIVLLFIEHIQDGNTDPK